MANIKEAIEYAKLNPNTTFATELRRRIESGQMDNELQGAGLTQYITPKEPGGLSRVVDTYSKNLKEQALGGVENAQKSFAMGVDTMQQAQQIPLDSGANKDKAILTGAAGAGQIGVGAASGLVQTYFSPLTALVQTGVQGLKELDTATGGKIQNQLTTLAQSHPELIKGYSDMVTQNPKTAQFVMDSINVLTAGLGAKPLATATTDLTKGAITGAKEAISNIPKVSPMSVVPKNLSQKAVDLISSDPGAKVETILKRSSAQELDNYLNIAKNSAVSGEAKTVFETVGDKLAETTKVLYAKLKEIGRAKSEIVTPLREGLGAFKNETTPLIQKLISLKNNLSEVDRGQKSIIQAVITDAKTVATKRGADMFIDKIQNAIYSGNVDMTIPRGSALDKQLRGLIGEYNTSLKKSLPKEYSQLNDQYSKLIDSLDTINRSLGEVVEGVPVRGASLIKQYFSPAGSKAKEIFEFIRKETNGEVDLAKDATLAKFAGQLYDDPNVNSLLGGIKDIPTTLGAVTGRLVEKVGGEKITETMRASTIRKAKGITSPK